MRKCISIFMGAFLLSACGSAGKASGSDSASVADSASVEVSVPQFDVDSAMSYLRHQVELGPRVPNTSAHRAAIDWLAAELRRHGAEVTLQPCDLTAYDGTLLHAVNIMGSYNPDLDDRLLLLAHFDTRPWADQDPDLANHSKPIAGANDGASGVAVMLGNARVLLYRKRTDSSGIADGFVLPAKPFDESQSPRTAGSSMANYVVSVSHPGYESVTNLPAGVFINTKTILPVTLTPATM